MEDDVVIFTYENVLPSDREFQDILMKMNYDDQVISSLLELYKKLESPKSNIPELVLRELVEWQYKEGMGRNNPTQNKNLYIIPIITESSMKLTHRADNSWRTRRGGAISRRSPAIPTPSAELALKRKPSHGDKRATLTVSFNRPIVCYVKSLNQYYVSPENAEITIIGLKFEPFCAPVSAPLADIGGFHPADLFLTCKFGNVFDVATSSYGLPKTPHYFADDVLGELNYFLDFLNNQKNYINSAGGVAFLEWQQKKSADLARNYTFANDVNNIRGAVEVNEMPPNLLGKELIQYLHERGLFEYPTSTSMTSSPTSSPTASPTADTQTLLPKNALISTIYQLGLGTIYERAVHDGFAAETTQQLIGDFFQHRKIAEEKIAHAELRAQNRIKLGLAAMLAPETAKWIEANPAATYDDFLDQLDAKQRKKVTRAIREWEARSSDFLRNSCPHVKLYYRLRQTGEGFSELRRYFTEPIPETHDIECVSCHMPIMCPHLVVIYSNITRRGANLRAIRAGLEKFAGDKLRGRISSHFCVLCGESLSFEVDEEHDEFSNDELSSFIWGELGSLLRFINYGGKSLQEHFGEQLPQFLSQIRNVIYPFINEYEAVLAKSRTDTAAELRAKMRLRTGIYAFAYFVILVESDKFEFVGFNGGGRRDERRDDKHSDSRVVELIKFCINKIIQIYNPILVNLPGVTSEDIKITFVDAYKELIGAPDSTRKIDTNFEDVRISPQNFVLNDYLYGYFYFIWALAHNRALRENEIISEINMESKTDGAVVKSKKRRGGANESGANESSANESSANESGANESSANESGANESLFGESSAVDAYLLVAPRKIGRYLNITLDLSRWNIEKYMNEKAVVGADAAKAFTGASFLKFVRRSVFGANVRGPEIPAAKFAQWSKARDAEKIRQQLHVYTYLKPVKSRLFVPQPVPLGRIYDENGNLHRFDILVFADGAETPESEFSRAQSGLAKIVAGNMPPSRIVDRKCSVCGIMRSAAESLSDAKITTALSQKHMLESFYRFYESRCPKGELHIMVKGVCKKCGFHLEYVEEALNQRPSKACRDYFESFVNAYKKERTVLHEMGGKDDDVVAAKPPAPVPQFPAKIIKSVEAWEFKPDVVAELAKKLNTNIHLIENLGLYEGRKIDEVKTALQSHSAVSVEEYRVYLLHSRVNQLIMQYNQVRFFHRIAFPSATISSLLENSNIKKHEYAKLEHDLEEIYDDFNEKYKILYAARVPDRLIQFLLGSLCEKALKIWNQKTAEYTKKLRHDFVRQFFEDIIGAESLMTTAEYFNWSAVFIEAPLTADTNLMREEDEDEIPPDPEAEGEESTAAPLENNFDIDAEGEALEDQQWDVGENYGLD